MPLPLAFEATGAGPPVVILHGLLGSSRNWQSVAKALASRHRVLCVDQRNHGRSPWAPTMGYSEMAADVRLLIEAQGLERPTLIGHSMGGKTAMVLALETPAAVGQLVVVDIAPVSYPDRFSSYVEAMQRVDVAHLTKRADANLQLATRLQDVDIVGFLMQNLVSQGSHFDWRVNLAAIGSMTTYRSLRFGKHLDLILTDLHSYRSEDPTAPDGANAFTSRDFPNFFPEEVQIAADAGRTLNGGKAPATIM